jgi:hypothetical protein
LNDGDSVVAIATTNGKKPDASDEADDASNSGEEIANVSGEESVDDNAVVEEAES